MKKILFLFLSFICAKPALPQAYTQTNIVTGLSYPVAFDIAPDGRFFVTQKGGGTTGSCANAKVQVFDSAGTFLSTFYDLTDSVNCGAERGVLGICLDPAFASNHFVYVYYNHIYLGDDRIRVVKFTENANTGTNPVIILDIDVTNGFPGQHVGGNIHMHASEPNSIYVVIGDILVSSNAPLLNVPYGKFLRINTDGTIPTDNPFYDDGDPLTGNDDRIWSYGHRNPFDFCFSAVNDSLYSSENGFNTWDEVNVIRKGNTYGWPGCEGDYQYNSSTNLCSDTFSVRPMDEWAAPVPSVTGILHYSGTAFPGFDNHLLVADYNNGKIWNCTFSNAASDSISGHVAWTDLVSPGGLTTLKEGSDECIYALKGGFTTAGIIYRICADTTTTNISRINSNREIKVFPNPASNEITIQFSSQLPMEQKENYFVEITDSKGQIIFSEKIPGNKIIVKTENFAEGIYFLKAGMGGSLFKTRKIVIVK